MEQGAIGEMSNASASTIVYPEPLASREHVFTDANIFRRTLNLFRFQMNIHSHPQRGEPHYNFQVGRATTDGITMDLHSLYKLVTAWGGYEKVESEKRWNQISISIIDSPVTNAPLYVKQLYLNLLYHYEQTYFFRREGPLSTPIPAPTVESRPFEVAMMQIIQRVAQAMSRRQTVSRPLKPIFTPGTQFSGMIVRRKVDCCYIVTIRIDGKVYLGEMYIYREVDPGSVAGSSSANMPQDPKNTENEQRTLQLF